MAPRGGVSRRGDAPAAPGRGDEARPGDGGHHAPPTPRSTSTRTPRRPVQRARYLCAKVPTRCKWSPGHRWMLRRRGGAVQSCAGRSSAPDLADTAFRTFAPLLRTASGPIVEAEEPAMDGRTPGFCTHRPRGTVDGPGGARAAFPRPTRRERPAPWPSRWATRPRRPWRRPRRAAPELCSAHNTCAQRCPPGANRPRGPQGRGPGAQLLCRAVRSALDVARVKSRFRTNVGIRVIERADVHCDDHFRSKNKLFDDGWDHCPAQLIALAL